MEIGPIPGIRPVPAIKSPPSDPRLPAVHDIDHSSRPRDDTYTGSGEAAAGSEDKQEETSEAEQPQEPESPEQTSSSIDLIA